MAANPTIKLTAITRAGYEYQDLVGIEVLIDYFRDPDLYEWVQRECDDEEFHALERCGKPGHIGHQVVDKLARCNGRRLLWFLVAVAHKQPSVRVL